MAHSNYQKKCNDIKGNEKIVNYIYYTAVFGKMYRKIFQSKRRHDDLPSKLGSLCTFKMILIKIGRKIF